MEERGMKGERVGKREGEREGRRMGGRFVEFGKSAYDESIRKRRRRA